MSTFNENTEHEDRPEFDDNGEPIIYIEEDVIPDEFASEYDDVIDLDVQDDSFYETVWGGDASSVATLAADGSTTGEEVTDPLEVEVEQDTKDTAENDGILEQAVENYNNAVDILVDILTQALAQGEITEEMNASILDAQGTKTKNEQIIKEICNVQQDNSILKQLEDIKANMVAASVDDILDILTQGGTKPWLYKDSDNNVLVDGQSIPELTVLVNKLNLIATGGDEASEIQLTPQFIKLVSSNINITAENIKLEGLVTANENFKILKDGSMMAKNGYFTGQIFVGDGSVIGDAALSDTIRNGANNGTLAIQKLNVVDADIENLKANKADITDLHTTNAEIDNLKANKADIEYLDANYATIQQLNAANANISNLQANKANITDLNTTNANISNLNATVGNIQTLVNGNLTSDNIQSMVITGDKFTVANGFIKNAMIDSVSANKINAGIINTNNVSIQSNDGSMLLQGNLQQFKDKNGKVRIQIGKDAKGNFTFCLYDENGTGQLINEKGIQSSNAIADGLIVDAKVAENANIAGSKLDIDSVVTEVNNGSTSIKGTKIYLDNQKQSLDVAFNNMTTTVKGNTDTLNTHTTSINAMDGKVTQLISDTTITKQDGTTTSLKDAYNATVDTVNSHSTKIGSLETNLSTANNNISSVSSKQTALEQNLNGFKQTVSDTYTTKADFNGLQVGGTNLLLKTKNFDDVGGLNKTGETYRGLVVRGINSIPDTTTYICEYVFTDFDYKDVFTFSFYAKGNLTNLCAFFYGDAGYVPAYLVENSVGVKANGAGDGHSDFGKITSDWKRYWVTWQIAGSGGDKSKTKRILLRTDGSKVGESIYVCGCKLERGNKATEWTPAPQDIDSAINTVDNKFANYSTTSQMNSAINQKADSILSTVSSTYATTQSTSTLLKENITEYYLSTSNTTLSGGAWGTTPYTPTPGKYIWQRTKSVTNAGDIKYSNPICVSDEMYTVILENEVLLLKCNSDGEVI